MFTGNHDDNSRTTSYSVLEVDRVGKPLPTLTHEGKNSLPHYSLFHFSSDLIGSTLVVRPFLRREDRCVCVSLFVYLKRSWSGFQGILKGLNKLYERDTLPNRIRGNYCVRVDWK